MAADGNSAPQPEQYFGDRPAITGCQCPQAVHSIDWDIDGRP
jgi:hypothetical protein